MSSLAATATFFWSSLGKREPAAFRCHMAGERAGHWLSHTLLEGAFSTAAPVAPGWPALARLLTRELLATGLLVAPWQVQADTTGTASAGLAFLAGWCETTMHWVSEPLHEEPAACGTSPKAPSRSRAGPGQRPAAGCDQERQPARQVYFYDPSAETWGLTSQPTRDKLSWVLNSWVLVITQVSLFVLVSCNFSVGRQRSWSSTARRPGPSTPHLPSSPHCLCSTSRTQKFPQRVLAEHCPSRPAPLQQPRPPAGLMLNAGDKPSRFIDPSLWLPPPAPGRCGAVLPSPPCPATAQPWQDGARSVLAGVGLRGAHRLLGFPGTGDQIPCGDHEA